jgi:hypothetical protein
MSRPSRSGFAKREKEKARSEKRQLKLARRQKGKDEEPVAAAEAPEGVEPEERSE